MRVLVVCSYRDYIKDGIVPFVKEQCAALSALSADALEPAALDPTDLEAKHLEKIEIEYYLLHGKGVKGYLKEIPSLREKIREWKPDVIHAHYGLTCLLVNMATRRVPVVSTYHGTDINDPKIRRFSKIAIWLSAWNVFVSSKIMKIAGCEEGKKASLIPCGIDDTLFVPMEKERARALLMESGKRKVVSGKKYVLFTKQFDNPMKDYPLAKAAVDRVNESLRSMSRDKSLNDGNDVELLEFIGYTRDESVWLMNAVDAVIMTSKSEGSPQVIKEAMACGCPIVSVDVGDVKERITNIDGCYLVQRDDRLKMIDELAKALMKALAFEGKTNGREKLKKQNLSNEMVARKLLSIYNTVVKK